MVHDKIAKGSSNHAYQNTIERIKGRRKYHERFPNIHLKKFLSLNIDVSIYEIERANL